MAGEPAESTQARVIRGLDGFASEPGLLRHDEHLGVRVFLYLENRERPVDSPTDWLDLSAPELSLVPDELWQAARAIYRSTNRGNAVPTRAQR